MEIGWVFQRSIGRRCVRAIIGWIKCPCTGFIRQLPTRSVRSKPPQVILGQHQMLHYIRMISRGAASSFEQWFNERTTCARFIYSNAVSAGLTSLTVRTPYVRRVTDVPRSWSTSLLCDLAFHSTDLEYAVHHCAVLGTCSMQYLIQKVGNSQPHARGRWPTSSSRHEVYILDTNGLTR